MTKLSGLTCLVLVACCADASARCSGPRFATFNNQSVDSHITVNMVGNAVTRTIRISVTVTP